MDNCINGCQVSRTRLCNVCHASFCSKCIHNQRSCGYLKHCESCQIVMWICSRYCQPPKQWCNLSERDLHQLARERIFIQQFWHEWKDDGYFKCFYCERHIPGVFLQDFQNHQPVCDKKYVC
jgi:hypothetical protein